MKFPENRDENSTTHCPMTNVQRTKCPFDEISIDEVSDYFISQNFFYRRLSEFVLSILILLEWEFYSSFVREWLSVINFLRHPP